MNTLTHVILLAAVAMTAIAEEMSDISKEMLRKMVVSDAIGTPDLVRVADCAGVGIFLGDTTPSNSFVDIAVQQWWTAPLATNIVRVFHVEGEPMGETFPTNTPVVFFLVNKRQMLEGHPAFTIPEQYPPEWVYSITNVTEMSKLVFPDPERAWFRAGRDNGLVHTFATNLWECIRANPNPTNYYHVLRDTERTVSMQDSWRVNLDAYISLSWYFIEASEGDLAEKLDDPLLTAMQKGMVRSRLYDKFGWRYIDGVITPQQ